MKIRILSINYWPEVTGIGAFITYRAEYLAAAGHDVEVCTTFPYYPEWRVSREYTGKFAATESRNGVKIVRSYAYIPELVTAAKRVAHEASFILSVLLRCLGRAKPDLLVVVSPPLGLAVPAILLSVVWRCPYVFDVQDLQPDAAGDLGMLPAWAVKALYRLEKAAYRNARLVTTLTHNMRKKIIAKGVPIEKVALVEPRMDESLIDIESCEGERFRDRYGLGRKFLVTHSGNIGVKQGLDVVLDAAVLGRRDDTLLFLFVGNGADCDRIKQRATTMDLQNVRFMPLLDQDEFRELMAASNICLVTQQKSVSEIAFPSKVVTYLAAGRPIVASVNSDSEVARVIRESGAGSVVEPGNSDALLSAIQQLQSQDLKQAGQNARHYARLKWSSIRVLGDLEASLTAAAESSVNAIA